MTGATPTVVLVWRLLMNSTAGDDVTLISMSVMGLRGFHDISCNTNCGACLKTADELHSRLWCYIDINECYRLQFVCQWVEWLQCSDVSMLLYCCWGAKLRCLMTLSIPAPGRGFHGKSCNTNCGACLDCWWTPQQVMMLHWYQWVLWASVCLVFRCSPSETLLTQIWTLLSVNLKPLSNVER